MKTAFGKGVAEVSLEQRGEEFRQLKITVLRAQLKTSYSGHPYALFGRARQLDFSADFLRIAPRKDYRA